MACAEIEDSSKQLSQCGITKADEDTVILDPSYNQRLRNAIADTFGHHVTQPTRLMRVIQKYNCGILTPDDMDFVKTQDQNKGRMAANEALLDRLHVYKNWFHYLLLSVKDEGVRLGFLEREFQDIKDDLDEMILSESNEEQAFLSYDQKVTGSQRKENLRLKIKLALEQVTENQRKEISNLKEALEHIERKYEQEKTTREQLSKEVEQGKITQNKLAKEVQVLNEGSLPDKPPYLINAEDAKYCFVSDWRHAMLVKKISITLLGRTGAGKSATGNSILGRKCFESHGGIKNGTMHRVVETCDYNGLTLEVIDGPGFCEEYPHRYSSYLEESIAEYIESAGPVSFFQIFVLVLIYGMPYSEEDQTLLWALYRRLEPNCVRMFIIYTNGDHFRKEEMTSGKTFSQWFTEQGFSPREHYSGAVLFDNKTDDVEILQKQRQRLLHLIFNQIRQTYNKS